MEVQAEHFTVSQDVPYTLPCCSQQLRASPAIGPVWLSPPLMYVCTKGMQTGRIPGTEGKQSGGIAAFMQVSRAGGITLAFNLFFFFFLRNLSETKQSCKSRLHT